MDNEMVLMQLTSYSNIYCPRPRCPGWGPGRPQVWLRHCMSMVLKCVHVQVNVQVGLSFFYVWFGPATWAALVAQLVRASPTMQVPWVQMPPKAAIKSYCFGQVVLCCFVFELCSVALPCFSKHLMNDSSHVHVYTHIQTSDGLKKCF